MQNARGRFRIAAAAPAIENVIVIATLLVAGGRIPGNGEITDARVSDLVLLGAGSTLGPRPRRPPVVGRVAGRSAPLAAGRLA